MLCPSCSDEIADAQGFVPWCPSCEWGLDKSRPAPEGRLAKRREALNEKLSERLFKEVVSDSAARVTSLRMMTLGAALAVHVLTAALFVVSIVLLFVSTPLGTDVQYAVAILLLLLVLATQPVNLKALVRKPKPTGIRLDRQAAPGLFDCLDEVAKIVGTTTPDVVIVGSQFNASMAAQPGRKVGLHLGLSLWFTLTWSERVALLGHELAHRVNGDLRNGRLVGGALVTLHRWAWLFRPDTTRRGRRITRAGSRGSLVVLGELLVPLVLFPITLAILGVAAVLRLFANRQGQRSEYIADKIAAEVGGTEAAAALLEKLSLRTSVQITVSRTVKFKQSDNPWATLEAYAGSIPDTELERLRRIGARRYEQIDATHPPNFMRAEAVNSRPAQVAQVVLRREQTAKITEELRSPAQRAAAMLERAYGV